MITEEAVAIFIIIVITCGFMIFISLCVRAAGALTQERRYMVYNMPCQV